VADLAHDLAMWRRLAGARARSQMQYPVSFGLTFGAALLSPLVDLVALLIVFANTPALATWSRPEVVLLFAIGGCSFWAGEATVGSVDTLSARIREGTFDALLLRPVRTMVQLCGDSFAPRRLSRLGLALVVTPIALHGVHVHWTAVRVIVLVLAVLNGFAVFGSIWVVTAAVAFWIVDAAEFGNAFTYGGNAVSTQPLDIYTGWLRRFVTYVLPIGFATYLPVAYVLDKPFAPGLPRGLVAVCPLAGVLAVLVARAVWRAGIRHYQSTGS
jgi:ABC-2 type transport system permease protein